MPHIYPVRVYHLLIRKGEPGDHVTLQRARKIAARLNRKRELVTPTKGSVAFRSMFD
jgi:hypothetical protein